MYGPEKGYFLKNCPLDLPLFLVTPQGGTLRLPILLLLSLLSVSDCTGQQLNYCRSWLAMEACRYKIPIQCHSLQHIVSIEPIVVRNALPNVSLYRTRVSKSQVGVG